ncbi:MAG: DUF1223 domain-containing protein [Myxococcales bacterium FL481]|nr:MAG: DUF1223 domain-containing protein [Myxococcales bacterium FL481]
MIPRWFVRLGVAALAAVATDCAAPTATPAASSAPTPAASASVANPVDPVDPAEPAAHDEAEQERQLAVELAHEPVGPLVPPAGEFGETGAFVVLELFSSQGCNHCPPADHVLSDVVVESMQRNPGVIVVSFHVPYFDDLGWADPFGHEDYAARQERYEQTLPGEPRRYTPQLIVNGTEQFEGSRRRLVKEAIARHLARPAPVRVNVTQLGPRAPGEALPVRLQIAGAPADAVVHVALLERNLAVPVTAGENRGHTLRHDNVVRAFVTKPAAAVVATQLTVPAGVVLEHSSVAAYVQSPGPRAVLGATQRPVTGARISGASHSPRPAATRW